jgi:large subunit ribosomal protein L23
MIEERKNTLIHPVISEKNTDQEVMHKYTFTVTTKSKKAQIKEDIEKMFKGIKVEHVNVLKLPGKSKRTRTGYRKTQDVKRAIVTIKKGQKIDILEQQR